MRRPRPPYWTTNDLFPDKIANHGAQNRSRNRFSDPATVLGVRNRSPRFAARSCSEQVWNYPEQQALRETCSESPPVSLRTGAADRAQPRRHFTPHLSTGGHIRYRRTDAFRPRFEVSTQGRDQLWVHRRASHRRRTRPASLGMTNARKRVHNQSPQPVPA